MKRFAVFLLLLLLPCVALAQTWTPISASSSIGKLSNFGRKYAISISGQRQNYDSTGSGDWRVIRPTVRHFDPPVFGYNYGVRCGEYWALFPDSSDSAVAFAVKKGRHALTMHLAGAIYYSHARDSTWILALTGTVAGTRQGRRATYSDVMPDVDWTFEYQNERLKTGIVFKQAARNALPSPAVKGWSDAETWMGFALELKTYSFTDTGVVEMPEVNWGDLENVWFSYLDELLFFLPVDIAYLYSDPSLQTTLYRRFKEFAGKRYLIIGLTYVTLQAVPSGAIVFDPSPALIGASDIDDAGSISNLATNNYGTATISYIGTAGPGNKRYYLWPDLSGIPSWSTINSAVCSCYCTAVNNAPNVEVAQLDSDWVEGTANGAYEFGSSSWNNRGHGTGVGGTTIAQADSAWSSGGGDYSSPDDTVAISAASWAVFEVETIVQSWVNAGTCFGFQFREKDEGGDLLQGSFATTEYATAAYRPRLYIEYTPLTLKKMFPAYAQDVWPSRDYGSGKWGILQLK